MYSVSQYADDLAWLCGQLGVARTSVLGHSMGGAVALEMGYRFRALIESVAMLDTVFQPPSAVNDILAPILPGFAEPAWKSTYRALMRALSLPSDDAALKPVLQTLPKATQHVLLSSLKGHLEDHDFVAAAAGCSAPVAYIGAAQLLASLSNLKELIPELMIGGVLGAGHFAPLVVPEQVNCSLRHAPRRGDPCNPSHTRASVDA